MVGTGLRWIQDFLSAHGHELSAVVNYLQGVAPDNTTIEGRGYSYDALYRELFSAFAEPGNTAIRPIAPELVEEALSAPFIMLIDDSDVHQIIVRDQDDYLFFSNAAVGFLVFGSHLEEEDEVFDQIRKSKSIYWSTVPYDVHSISVDDAKAFVLRIINSAAAKARSLGDELSYNNLSSSWVSLVSNFVSAMYPTPDQHSIEPNKVDSRALLTKWALNWGALKLTELQILNGVLDLPTELETAFLGRIRELLEQYYTRDATHHTFGVDEVINDYNLGLAAIMVAFADLTLDEWFGSLEVDPFFTKSDLEADAREVKRLEIELLR